MCLCVCSCPVFMGKRTALRLFLGSLAALELTKEATWPTSPRHPPAPASPELGLQEHSPTCLACSLFQYGFWELNSGPRDCKAYTGRARPSPKPLEVSFLGDLESNPVQLPLLPAQGHTQNILPRIYVPGLQRSHKPMSSSNIVGKEKN